MREGGVYLEDLYVEEAHRGKGVAKALFRHLGKMCEEQDLARLDWVVLDWNVVRPFLSIRSLWR